jgi:hypothetical protein
MRPFGLRPETRGQRGRRAEIGLFVEPKRGGALIQALER